MAKFVKVSKDGEVLEVHPTCLKAHIEAGWKELSAEELTESKAEVKAETKGKLDKKESEAEIKQG